MSTPCFIGMVCGSAIVTAELFFCLESYYLLCALMAQHGGHSKAIRELQNTGLRSKTLDQKRKKIKDALISVLGEHTASEYLFSNERDPVSARLRYRLSLAEDAIKLWCSTGV